MDEYVAKLMEEQGRAIDGMILSHMERCRSVYEKVCLRVEVRSGSGLGIRWSSWNRYKVSAETNVRVVRDDLSWAEFQWRARALREAGAL